MKTWTIYLNGKKISTITSSYGALKRSFLALKREHPGLRISAYAPNSTSPVLATDFGD